MIGVNEVNEVIRVNGVIGVNGVNGVNGVTQLVGDYFVQKALYSNEFFRMMEFHEHLVPRTTRRITRIFC